ncbi:olfactory receptor 1L4-like isoform X3 [Mastomys coucha]|uniref:olfactory receptor 1L4-like isoform X3 n=1 Tax=Mastomys coucha TaxID=35658 RepID=UPI00126154A4|nr:olfactory receptor 1L4-like isoform X3 [Mastomys coucha]
MAVTNLTYQPQFQLLGLMDGTDSHPLLFLLFLSIYLLNVLGNLSIVVLVRSDGALCSPMYYFLGHLSLVDVCFTTVTVPRLLATLLHPGQAMSFQACFAQMYFFVALGITESYLLAAMSYDRAVAVCRPLHYGVVMTPWRCFVLVAASWAVAHLHSLLHTLLISALSYPRSAPVRHFFCDMTVMLSLATSDTSAAETAIFSEGLAVVLTPLLLVSLSYAHILVAVLGMRTTGGRHRVFSTCGTHLVVTGAAGGMQITSTGDWRRSSSTVGMRNANNINRLVAFIQDHFQQDQLFTIAVIHHYEEMHCVHIHMSFMALVCMRKSVL